MLYSRKEWVFKVFIDDNQKSDFLEWREALPIKARAKMDSIITYMEIIKDWTQTPYFTPLTGYKGICEIKFIVSNIQYRPLGCYGPGTNNFTLLIGAEEKGDKFKPKSAPDIASRRRKLILKNRRYTDDY